MDEPSSSILWMLLRRGEVILCLFKWTSVAFVIAGLKYSASLSCRSEGLRPVKYPYYAHVARAPT